MILFHNLKFEILNYYESLKQVSHHILIEDCVFMFIVI